MRAEEDLELLGDDEEEALDEQLDEQMGELEDRSTIEVDEHADEKKELPHALANYQDVVGAMQAILDGKPVALDKLPELGDEQREALETLQIVVRGRSKTSHLVYAEHRLEGLNQVLAVLQPVLSVGVIPGLEGLKESLNHIVDQIDDLRHHLDQLDGAEEEYMFDEEALAAGESDQDDKPKPDDGLGEVTDKPRPSFLAGKPGDKPVERPERPTTLTGKPEAPERVEQPTTLTGKPEAPERVEQPTTLTGKPGDKPVELPERKSTLS